MIKRTKKEPSKNAKLFWLVVRRTLIKAAVDTVLFILSFTLQREWVFGGKKKND